MEAKRSVKGLWTQAPFGMTRHVWQQTNCRSFGATSAVSGRHCVEYWKLRQPSSKVHLFVVSQQPCKHPYCWAINCSPVLQPRPCLHCLLDMFFAAVALFIGVWQLITTSGVSFESLHVLPTPNPCWPRPLIVSLQARMLCLTGDPFLVVIVPISQEKPQQKDTTAVVSPNLLSLMPRHQYVVLVVPHSGWSLRPSKVTLDFPAVWSS